MAQSILEILLKLTGSEKAKSQLSSLEKGLKQVGGTMQKMGGIMTAGVTLPLVGAGIAAIKFASNTAESLNKVDVVFGKSSKIIKTFAEDAATNLGMSNQQALEAAGTFGNLFTAMDVGQPAAAEMSTQLLTLASDLASFNNIDPTVALEKLRAGLVGEAEPLRTLGVNINETAVELKALELGLISEGEEMTNAQKVAARFALIMDQTKNSQGDFARTADGLANSTRILKAEFADAAAELGQELLPIAIEMVGAAKGLLEKFKGLDDSTKGNIIRFAALAAAAGPALLVLGSIVKMGGTLITVGKGVVTTVEAIKVAMVAANVSAGAMLVTLGLMAAAFIAVSQAVKKYQEVQQEVDKGMEGTKVSWKEFFDQQIAQGKNASEIIDAYQGKMGKLKLVFDDINPLLRLFIDENEIIAQGEAALRAALDRATVSLSSQHYALQAATEGAEENTTAVDEEIEATNALNISTSALSEEMLTEARIRSVLLIAQIQNLDITNEEKNARIALIVEQQKQLEMTDKITAAMNAGKVSWGEWAVVMADGIVTVDEYNSVFGEVDVKIGQITSGLQIMGGAIRDLPKQTDINIDVWYREHGQPIIQGSQIAFGQHGLNFTVPPGFPHDTYPVMVSSGEHVQVTPNYNLTVNTNAPWEPIIDDFNLMRARAAL